MVAGAQQWAPAAHRRRRFLPESIAPRSGLPQRRRGHTGLVGGAPLRRCRPKNGSNRYPTAQRPGLTPSISPHQTRGRRALAAMQAAGLPVQRQAIGLADASGHVAAALHKASIAQLNTHSRPNKSIAPRSGLPQRRRGHTGLVGGAPSRRCRPEDCSSQTCSSRSRSLWISSRASAAASNSRSRARLSIFSSN